MRPLSLTRLTMGIVILAGLVFFKPLAYFAGAMMVFAGLTGICLLELFFAKILGSKNICSSNYSSQGEPSLVTMSARKIKEAVKQKYSAVAEQPQKKFSFPVGKAFAESIGYPKRLLDNLPDSFTESFTGAGNPHPHIKLKKGMTVLDIGCGAGLDMYIYAKAVGPSGKVIGVDISDAMVRKARENFAKAGLGNAKVIAGHSDNIPLPDSSVDAVLSNGIYNLSPNKKAVMQEVLRVLKPGGRTVFSEILLKSQLLEEIRTNIKDWFRCIGGAITEVEFVRLMKKTGFQKVKVLAKERNARTAHPLAVCATIQAFKPVCVVEGETC